MIEATYDKLDEARFFLGHLREEAAKVMRQKPEAFGHYLSAFITAARSVPWVLQCEEKEKYLAWRETWDAAKTDEELELEEFTNERRLDEVKRKGAQTKTTWEEVSIFKLPTEQANQFQVSGAIRYQNLALGAAAPPTVNRAVHHFKEGGQSNVIATCERYLEYLEKMVREFVKAHENVSAGPPDWSR
jgi:hypothetical protein